MGVNKNYESDGGCVDMTGLIAYILIAAGAWRVFEKMGREGWEGIIPFYSTFVLFEELYGSGWKILLFLIPFYNIYVAIKFNIDIAREFNLHGAYGIGLLFLPVVCYPLLGFGDAVYKDGSFARTGDNPVSRGLENLSDHASRAKDSSRANDAIERIRQLDDLRKSGIITDEEFERKKTELLNRI